MCNNNTNEITDIKTLQFIHKLCNFVHIISMQSNAAAISHCPVPAGFQKFEPGTSLLYPPVVSVRLQEIDVFYGDEQLNIS